MIMATLCRLTLVFTDANRLVSLTADQLDGDPGLWEFLSPDQVRLVTLAREHQLADRRARVQVRHFSTQSFHGTWNSILRVFD
jgi:hypothetical protein